MNRRRFCTLLGTGAAALSVGRPTQYECCVQLFIGGRRITGFADGVFKKTGPPKFDQRGEDKSK